MHVATNLADIELADEQGRPVRLGTLWSDRPAVLAFVRHSFASYLLRLDSARAAFTWINTLFTLILFPSALWMPLAFEYLDAPSAALWWGMRATLAVVGVSSLGLVVALRRLAPPGGPHALLALAGAAAFTFQTLVLDALVWPLYFAR